jgi:hypothetical protein
MRRRIISEKEVIVRCQERVVKGRKLRRGRRLRNREVRENAREA